jgi:transposase
MSITPTILEFADVSTPIGVRVPPCAIFSKCLYKLRWRIESAFNRLKDFRRIATRYDRLARNYLASVCLAAALVRWI